MTFDFSLQLVSVSVCDFIDFISGGKSFLKQGFGVIFLNQRRVFLLNIVN